MTRIEHYKKVLIVKKNNYFNSLYNPRIEFGVGGGGGGGGVGGGGGGAPFSKELFGYIEDEQKALCYPGFLLVYSDINFTNAKFISLDNIEYFEIQDVPFEDVSVSKNQQFKSILDSVLMHDIQSFSKEISLNNHSSISDKNKDIEELIQKEFTIMIRKAESRRRADKK